MISAEVPPMGVRFCMMVARAATCLLPFGADIFRSANAGSRKEFRVDRFWPLRHR